MVAAVSREVQSVVLLLLGGAVLRISLTDVHLRYVQEWMLPALVAAGLVLVLLGLAAAWYDGLVERRPRTADAGVAASHGHDHAGGPRVAWLLLTPVLAIFLVAPPALGSYAAERDSGGVTDPGDTGYPPLPPGEPVETTILDYSTRAVWDEGRTLEGRTVRLTGFVSPREQGGWFLTRIALSCCAADGRAFKVEVVDGPDAPPVDTWVEVTGEWVANGAVLDDDAVPAVRVLDLTEIDIPRNPYENG